MAPGGHRPRASVPSGLNWRLQNQPPKQRDGTIPPHVAASHDQESPLNLNDLFSISRARKPQATALEWIDEDSEVQWSYEELWSQVEALAGGLSRYGIQPGDRIAFFLGNRPEFVIAYLATLHLGAVVVPMNLAYRKREIEHMLSDSEPRLMVTEDTQLEILSDVGEEGLSTVEELVVVERLERWLAGQALPPPRPLAGSDLALLMYTSGTTGPSKGARLTHDNILATVTGLLAAWDWSAEDTLLLTLPLFHTHGLIVGLTTALAAGATVRLHRKFEATAVWAELLSGEVDLFFGVPTLYRRLLDHAAGHRARYDLKHMRLLCSGSAPLSPDLHETFLSVTGQPLLERYGMTETGMNLSNPYLGKRRPGTVGTPLPGVSARIVDAEGCRIEDGDQGELEVRGSNVFDGYWRAVEKTRESFTSDEVGQRWFRTGDLARCDPETGYFTLLGRRAELIISGGYNIYPREVEEVLCAFPGITEAAVVGIPSREWGEIGVAYVVCTSSFACDDLLAFCRRHIAAFKVPKEIRPIDALPRNALGKVQKHRLPQ